MGIKERDERQKKNAAFRSSYYVFVDQMLECKCLDELQYGIESLLAMNEQVGINGIYHPLNSFDILKWDMQYFSHGLTRWPDISAIFEREGEIKQVLIIKELDLEKDAAGFFFYTLANMGILEKKKSGRNNVLSYKTDKITKSRLQKGWPGLFGKSSRMR